MATQTDKTAAAGTDADTVTDTDPAAVKGAAAEESGADRPAEGSTGKTADSAAKGDGAEDALTEADPDGTDSADLDDLDELDAPVGKVSSGVGAGAAAVLSATLGVVGLSGGWLGSVASARQSLIGQLEASSSGGGDVAAQIQGVYGDAWQAAALVGGAFALAALLIGAFTLARPAFGAPDSEPAPWIKSVAWAGVGLGLVGLLLAVAKYTDVLLGLPSAT
ncbi:hypothetical protein ACFV0R_34330 [Streptomyces sp. NPDC059578]|uniref:hypothetical protein n=1 Tax=Streptomyces sp. NPDC059578 TaxID=3346874 RepID=UPI0036B15715